jgi:DHA1 family multidrug resistance protein-like MFS transporter
MRAFQGFSSGLWPMDLAIMTLYAPPAKMGLCLGIMQGVLTAGGVIGPLLGGILAESFGMRLSFFLASGALFLNFLMFVFFIKEPPASTTAKQTTAAPATGNISPWHIPLIRTMLLCGTCTQMVILILQPILTTYITVLAGPVDNLIFISGLVFSLGGIAGAVTAPFWGTFGQHHGFFRAMAIALACAGIGLILQGLPDDLYAFAAMQFICGLFFAGIQPAINAILAQATPAAMKGRIFGLLFAAQQVGSMAGPIFGGIIATLFGMKTVFYTAGLIFLSMGSFIYYHFIRPKMN